MSVRGGFFEGDTYVVIENDMNRVVAEGTAPFFDQVTVYERVDDREWHEVLAWDSAEWREAGGEAFEAILGVIAKVAGFVRVERPSGYR